MSSDRFDRFLPLAGVLAGLLFFSGLFLLRDDPSNETGPAKTFAYWQANHGQHQIIGLLVAPLIAFLLVFFAAGLKRSLERGSDSAHGTVALGGRLFPAGLFSLGGMLCAAVMFAVVGRLEAAMTSAAKEGQQGAVYTLNQFHSYDWLGWNAAFAAALLATGIGARRNGMLPTSVAWATIVIGASLLTPLGYFGFVLIPLWLVVVGFLLSRRSPDAIATAAALATPHPAGP